MLFRQIKFLPILLVLVLLFLQYRLWFDAGGFLEMARLKKQLVQQTEENATLKKNNLVLLQQIKSLRSSQEAIEARARQELGMIKEDETFYQIID